ncbi:1-acyl-sn-glycerol-3-phosphate acyltransferase, partial [Phocaeicola vulgatus]|nr:1-acyl-sn-glycerol-3-phosphate acyltransferase [Phocaeicola vulgatus]
MNETDKEAVYPLFQPKEKVVIFDRGYFASQWVSAVNQDFYLILYISSFLIFFALWISYGRIELTLMSFLPMLVSWIIIVGLMGMLGIEFNIINIILSTFIFGIGDDFSIFIMDGLQNKYRTGRQLLNSHKTAIFFSAFTTVIGMGTLVFARHPALQSISLISILGMIAVVLVAYTLQPILFRFFITAPASKGLPPYTLTGLARTGGLFLLFFIGCLFLRLLIAVMTLLPIRKAYKKQVLCQLIHVTCKSLIHIATFVHKERINRTGETFKKPAILIANHQSFIDILVLLALTPKLVMVTNHWVWHSPFFGAIIRYADFYYVGDGYELYVERMRQKVKEGYSIAIFPEGTRTYDGRMKRFHKGAFYLSEKLQLDIIPVILYGNCKIIAKAQPFNVRKGIMLTEILPRIPANDATYGTTYQERTKSISARMKKEYARICREQSTTDNPVFYENLIQNYIYKGPVEEW